MWPLSFRPKSASSQPSIYSMQACPIKVTESAAAARSLEQVVHTAVHELALLGTCESLNLGSTESTSLTLVLYMVAHVRT